MGIRSNNTQVLQNYFDSKLVRTRENPYCIDAQLLNIASGALDDAKFRYDREIKALQLPYCPTGLDNGGVYYSVKLDSNYSISTNSTLNSIQGVKNGVTTNISLYDDTLPIPAGYQIDPNRSSIQLANPILTTFSGSAELVILSNPININLPVVNRVGFWLDCEGVSLLSVSIRVYGVKYPVSPWQINEIVETEVVNLSGLGYAETLSAWSYIDHIVVRNLPVGATLNCYSMNFGLPASRDVQRSATIPGFIDQTFDKYWEVKSDENLLQESYLLDNLSGLVYYQSYNLSQAVSCVAVEPNTWGGILGSGTSLSYFDRRELMPNLAGTGLTQEPCYGLDVFYDVSRPGSGRNVIIRPVPYANASLVNQFRFVVQLPNGNTHVLLPNGSYLPYGSNVGWQSGTPTTLTLPLIHIGLYTITLQCVDTNGGNTSDVFPYQNFDLADVVKTTFDVSNLVVNIEGICYDFLGNLWIYDGLWAVPLIPFYNGYLLDPVGRNIYLTDNFSQVTYT